MKTERIKQKLTLQEALDLAMKEAGENIQDIQIFTKDYRKIWIESRYDGYRVYRS
jgi:hypothetical protein